MKTKRLNIILILLAGLFIGSISCNKFEDLRSPIEGFNVILNYDIFDTFITIRMIDAPTGELIGALDDEKVEINITGDAADAIVDQIGNHSTQYNTVFGMVSLALNPKDPWKPSAENILSLNFEAKNERYKTTNLDVRIDSTGNYRFDIYMEQTNVDKLGIKEYTLFLPLNGNNTLASDFIFTSSGNEILIKIPKGSEFTGQEGTTVTGQRVKLNLKVFLSTGRAPVSTSLINNLKLINGENSIRATDFYNIYEISFFTEEGEEIKNLKNTKLELKSRISSNNYNSEKKRLIQEDDQLFSYSYNNISRQWEENEKLALQNDSTGLYTITFFDHFSFKSFGNSKPTCNVNGQFKFVMLNKFDELPVGIQISLYRKRDNRYISSKAFQVANNEQVSDFNYTSIFDEPVRFYIYNQSSYNPFTVEPVNIYSEVSCGILSEMFNIKMTSLRAQINNQLKLICENLAPTESIDVYLDIYNAVNNSLLYRKSLKLNPSDSIFNITTGIIANNNVYLKILPVDNFITLSTKPEKISFNTSTGPFNWEMRLAYTNISSEFIFNFNIDDSFGNKELFIRADYYNLKTEKVDYSFTFPVSKNNPAVSKKIVINENSSYRINLKRVEGKEPFMAYPYKQSFDSNNKVVTTFNSTLFPVEKKQVTANLKLTCGSSIIYPSVNGMYRTVWEDKWKDTEIKNGHFSEMLEIGSTYEIGTIFEGKLVSTEYKIIATDINMTIELEGGFCDEMGW